jgi:hypothetical protein
LNDKPLKVKTSEPFNYVEGPQHLEKLTLFPSSIPVVDEEHFATSADEMKLD